MDNLTQLGLVVGITMALIEVIKLILNKGFSLVSKQFDKGGKDNKQEIEIAVLQEKLDTITNNHLAHIQKALDQNTDDHQKIFVCMGKIETKLEQLKK